MLDIGFLKRTLELNHNMKYHIHNLYEKKTTQTTKAKTKMKARSQIMTKNSWDSFLNKPEASKLKEFAAKIKDEVETVTARIGAKTGEAKSCVQTASRRLRKKWSGIELWNFGSWFLERQACICTVLAECEYNDPRADEQYRERLRDCAITFKAFVELDDISLSFDDIQQGSVPLFFANNAIKDEQFMPKWEWYCNNVLRIENFIAPKKKEINKNRGIVEKSRDFAKHVKYKMNAWIDEEYIYDMPQNELMRISEMLSDFAAHSVGYQDGYLASGDALDNKDKNWENSTPNFSFLIKGNEITEHLYSAPGGGIISTKTRKEIGKDQVAWFEDINEVSDILRTYVDWNSPIKYEGDWSYGRRKQPELVTMTPKECLSVFGEERAEELQKAISDQLDKAFVWLGRVGTSLWD